MDDKYKKAIKAGLICALLLVVIHLLTDIIFYWAMTKPTLAQWVSQQASASPPVATSFEGVPPEAIIAGFAIIIGGLLIFVMFLLAGALAAFFLARQVKSTWDMILPGAIAGAITQAVSTPFTLLIVLLMKIYPAYGEPETDIWPWLGGQLIYQYGQMLVIAIVLATLAALACGFVIKALYRNKAAA